MQASHQPHEVKSLASTSSVISGLTAASTAIAAKEQKAALRRALVSDDVNIRTLYGVKASFVKSLEAPLKHILKQIETEALKLPFAEAELFLTNKLDEINQQFKTLVIAKTHDSLELQENIEPVSVNQIAACLRFICKNEQAAQKLQGELIENFGSLHSRYFNFTVVDGDSIELSSDPEHSIATLVAKAEQSHKDAQAESARRHEKAQQIATQLLEGAKKDLRNTSTATVVPDTALTHSASVVAPPEQKKTPKHILKLVTDNVISKNKDGSMRYELSLLKGRRLYVCKKIWRSKGGLLTPDTMQDIIDHLTDSRQQDDLAKLQKLGTLPCILIKTKKILEDHTDINHQAAHTQLYAFLRETLAPADFEGTFATSYDKMYASLSAFFNKFIPSEELTAVPARTITSP